MRKEGRGKEELRPVTIERGVLKYAEGSALIRQGDTQVLCAASVLEEVPAFLVGRDSGWVTAEYALLPRSTLERTPREAAEGRIRGRTHEIQRLIGRVLRSVVELGDLKGVTIRLDCDVLQADGGTRTAAVTGAFVALMDAVRVLLDRGRIPRMPVREAVAAVSVGLVDGDVLLDLDYEEDRAARVDMNVAMTGKGEFVEIQGTAEGAPFDRRDLEALLNAAEKGIRGLLAVQVEALGGIVWEPA